MYIWHTEQQQPNKNGEFLNSMQINYDTKCQIQKSGLDEVHV